MSTKKTVRPKPIAALVIVILLIIAPWYPKTSFGLRKIGDSLYVPNTLRAPFGFSISFREQTYTSWKDDVITVFYTETPFESIEILKFTYEWEGGCGPWGKTPYTTPAFYWQKSGESGAYENMFVGDVPSLIRINFHKIFKGKKLGDEFEFALKIVYSIDDGPEIIQTIKYHVTVYKERLRIPILFGLVP